MTVFYYARIRKLYTVACMRFEVPLAIRGNYQRYLIKVPMWLSMYQANLINYNLFQAEFEEIRKLIKHTHLSSLEGF